MHLKRNFILGISLLILVFLFAGCSSSDIVDDQGNKVGEVTKEDGETTVRISVFENAAEGEACESHFDCETGQKCIMGTCTVVECTFMSDCEDSDIICFQGKCMTDAELEERFDFWELNSMCQGTCDNCASGELKSIMSSGRDDQEYRLCADCMDDNDCKEGTWCVVGKCVASDAPAQEDVEEPIQEEAEEEPEAIDVGSEDPIVGRWDKGGFHYFFTEDGVMMLDDSQVVKGQWEHVSGSEYILKWDSYNNIDDVTLSADGNLLTGKRRNQDKDIELERLE